ncbi:MAG: hypothetical protein HY370_08715 [Proteobacteria bacterium]|nr:hypothetical protein [Pseudomonadota bacterium]
MNMRNWLLATVMGGGLFLTGQAYASSGGTVLQPVSQWSVSKIASRADDNNSYCAMARRYGGDTILTMARNSLQETSMAIDFQKNMLDSGQSYNIVLDAGFGQQRTFDLQPVSGKAIVVRMGRDEAFYDALERSGSLKFVVGDSAYSFSMPDIAEGQMQMQGCTASLAGPAAGDTVNAGSSMTPEMPSSPVAAVDRQTATDGVSAAGMEADALREENARLRSALERERRSFENQYMNQSGSSAASELAEKVRILESENVVLKQKVSSVPQQISAAPPPSCSAPDTLAQDALARDLQSLRAENDRLRSEVQSLNARVAQAQSAAAPAMSAADKQTLAEVGQLRGRVQTLEAENAGLQESLRVAQSAKPVNNGDGARVLSQLRSVEAQMQSVKVERDRLAAQVEQLSNTPVPAGMGSIESADWGLEQATRRFNEAEREVRRLGALLEQERMQCSSEKKEIEYMLFDPEIASQEQISKLMTLEEELMEAKEGGGDEIAAYKSEIATLQDRLASKENEVVDLNGRLASLETQSYNQKRYNIAAAPSSAAGGHDMAAVEASRVSPSAGFPSGTVSRAVATSTTGSYISAAAMQSFLQASGIDVADIKPVPGVSAGGVAYSWDYKGLYGSAEQGGSGDYATSVRAYLDKTKGRCDGDYAAMPVWEDQGAGGPVSAYEIACVGKSASAAASVVFFMQDGFFTAVAHEAPLESMDIAMDASESLASSLSQSKISSN